MSVVKPGVDLSTSDNLWDADARSLPQNLSASVVQRLPGVAAGEGEPASHRLEEGVSVSVTMAVAEVVLAETLQGNLRAAVCLDAVERQRGQGRGLSWSW